MIYLDTNVIIQFVESSAESRATFEHHFTGQAEFLTSDLSLLECRCGPIRKNDAKLLALYDALFHSPEIKICPLNRRVIDRTTDIRATTRLRTPDALHLASALVYGATHFFTRDRHFIGISLMPIKII